MDICKLFDVCKLQDAEDMERRLEREALGHVEPQIKVLLNPKP